MTVVLNITALNSVHGGLFNVYAAGSAEPATSVVNFAAGATVNNSAFVEVGTDGQVTIANVGSGTTDFIVDVEGYVTDSTNTAGEDTYASVTPSRIMDTRNGTGVRSGTVAPGSPVTLTVGGVGGIPATGVASVVLDITSASSTAKGFVTAWQTGQPEPSDSSLSFAGGVSITKTAVVPVSVSGTAQVTFATAGGSSQLIADVEGYFVAATGGEATTYDPVTPTRVLDTRSGHTPGGGGPIAANSTQVATLTGVDSTPAADVTAAVVNLTSPDAAAGGYVTAYADGTTRPSTSSLNLASGITETNLVIVPVSGAGAADFYVAGTSTDLLVDVVGYFTSDELTSPQDQARVAATTSLASVASSGYGYATYLDRSGPTGSWAQVPPGDVADQSTGASVLSAWPVAVGDKLIWQAANTLGSASGSLQVESCVSASATVAGATICSAPATLQVTPHAFDGSWATDSVGPGTVSLVTGDAQVSASDAAVSSYDGSLSVGREFDSYVDDHLTNGQKQAETAGADGYVADNATVSSQPPPTPLSGNALQIVPGSSGTTSDTYAAIGANTGLNLAMLPGHTYRFATNIYVPAGTGLPGAGDQTGRAERVVVFTHNTGGGSTYQESDAAAPTQTNVWQPEAITFTVPPSADQAFIRLYSGKPTGTTGPVYYDGTSLSDVGIFGPGWRSDLPGPDAGAGQMTVDDQTTQGYVVLLDSDGDQNLYQTRGSTTAYPISYTGQGDANDGSTLTKVSASTFTLTDADGTVTTWTLPSGSTSWQTASVVEAGTAAQNTTSYAWNGSNQVTQIVAPAPAGISTCTAGTSTTANSDAIATIGCRSLVLTYATSTTATGTGSSQWGDVAGQLKSVAYVAADPAHANTMTATTVVTYAYDNTGYLRQATDPRPATPLSTTYSYDSSGRISTITPAGLAAWTFGYDSQGRLATASRPDPSGSTATTTVAYNVPLPGGGSTGLPDMTAGSLAAWGQTDDLPVTGTAIFSPDHVPAASPTSSDWPYAEIHYLDVNGRETNTASYGGASVGGSPWQFGASDYDQYGNTLWSLTAQNRAEALSPVGVSGSCDPTNSPGTTDYTACVAASTQARAALLETDNTYSQDGVELLDTVEPIHPVTLTTGPGAGMVVDAREHTHTVYSDQDGTEPAHTGPAYRLADTVTDSAQTVDGFDHDTRTTVNGHAPIDASSATGPTSGWTLRTPTTVTTDPAGLDIVSATLFDASGRALQTRQPTDQASASRGTTAGTTVNTYYAASGSGACVSAVFAGMLCSTGPAAQPAGSGAATTLPTATTTYNYYGDPLVVTEVSGTSTRTTTASYDTADRPTGSAITGGLGTATPATTMAYDPATGLPTTSTAGGVSLTTGYDNLGQATSYTDADGNTSTTGHDLDGRATAVYDGKGTSTSRYDGTDAAGNTEHRGMVTSLVDSAAGTFTAAYNSDGSILTEVYPSGLAATWTYDNAGNPTSLVYAKGGTVWQTYSATYSAQGQIVQANGPLTQQHYAYDADSRLTQTQDVYGGSCTTRDYGYDQDTNRLTLASHPASSGATCSDTTTPTSSVSHSYNTGDQLTDTGYTYDASGRTLSVPAADLTSGGAMTLGYFSNDMVASETQGTGGTAVTDSFTLDPMQNRIRTETSSTTGLTTTNHYNDGTDSPAWTDNGDSTWTRDISGIDGNLAAIQTSAGVVTLQLPDLHGDIGATAPNSAGATGVSATYAYTEFGNPEAGITPPTYGSLGAKQRSTGDLGGLSIMGQRLYNATSGRFLQTDPVPGGSANAYDYCSSDPVDCTDLNGQWGHWRRWWHRFQTYASYGCKFIDGAMCERDELPPQPSWLAMVERKNEHDNPKQSNGKLSGAKKKSHQTVQGGRHRLPNPNKNNRPQDRQFVGKMWRYGYY